MKNTLCYLALARVPNIGPVTIKKLVNYFGHISHIFSSKPNDLRQAGLSEKQLHELLQIDWKRAEDDFSWAEKNNCYIITMDDAHYPPLLREIHAAPVVLYVKGQKDVLQRSQIAMVGSRNPTTAGKDLAEQFAAALTTVGLVITSGLALGIDAASHRGALKSGGNTIAVLGTGMQHIYPRSHATLAEQIMERGALVTEFPPDYAPKASHFPMRNRIISGLSLGVLVVEAAVQSGSLITARYAIEQNREVFAVPGSIHNPLARGCHQLLRQGAKLVETAKDVMEEFGFLPTSNAEEESNLRKVSLDLDPSMQRVFAQIGYESTALDVIIARSGLTTGEVSSKLLSLELIGYVKSVVDGYIRTGSYV